jgi:hypothetical protein
MILQLDSCILNTPAYCHLFPGLHLLGPGERQSGVNVIKHFFSSSLKIRTEWDSPLPPSLMFASKEGQILVEHLWPTLKNFSRP